MEKTTIQPNKLLASLVFLFFTIFGFAQTSPHTITSSTTFTVPAGVTSLQVQAWGGGGAGGGTTTATKTTGGGGGGGTYTNATTVAVTPGQVITVTIGAGGTGVSGANGNPGGTTTFASTVPVTAIGGNGGQVGNATTRNGLGAVAAVGITRNGGAGGTGNSTAATQGFSGGGGGSPGTTGDGGNASIGTGGIAGTGSPAGFAGANGRNSSGNGGSASGTNYGAGGAGGNNNTSTARSGGTGAKGKVIITWATPVPEINITGNSITIVDGDGTPDATDHTDFGSTNTGTPVARTYTIENTGTAALSVGTITLGDTTNYSITTAPAASVAAGSSTTFVVTFNPTTAGVKNTTISIVNGDSSENPYNFSLTGTGIPNPEINIQSNATSIANGDNTPSPSDNTDFGSLEVNSGTIIKTFTIQNIGSATLNIGSITITGTNASEFTVTTAPSATVAAASSTTFVITFDPLAVGTRTATISVANDDSDENPYVFDVKGEASQTFFDSDGDGVYDNVDVDDDNDGILDITEESNCNNANGHKVNYKFLNETFGASATRTTINTTYAATTTYCYQDATTPSVCEGSPNSTNLNDGKYTVGPSAQIATWAAAKWYLGPDHTAGDTDGRMALFNASYTIGTFYTASITGALPNLPITYNFWVINLDRTDAVDIATRIRPNIKVEFRDINDVVLQTISTGDIAPTTAGNLAGDWYQFTASINLNVDAFKVVFINNNTGGAGNDLAIDDISITQALCDLDNDGIADLFDLDADNDGIEDVIEAGLANTSNGKGKIDIAWLDGNGNGLHDSAEVTAALPALDSDADGVPNYIDLDSDNDSLFDVDESGAGNTNAVAGYVNGDGDINGDGVGDGPESEAFRSKDVNGDGSEEYFGDGILDIYDYGTGVDQYGNLDQGIATGNPATTYLSDTDGDGIPDYLDTTSNGATFDIANTLLIYDYKILDTDNDGVIDGWTDMDRDGIIDLFDTNSAVFGSPRDLHTKLFLAFDGRNDYGQSTAILGGLPNASLMAWINLNPAFATDGIVVGQDNFHIRITSDKKFEAIVNGTAHTYNTVLNVSQWYNVAAIYDGNDLKLYLNGHLVGTQAAAGAIAADASLFTIGKNPSANDKYFKGKIDEVRVFSSALTDSQLQRMVYQEINDFGSEIRGEIVPKNVATAPDSLPFANLLRYYRLDNYQDDVIDDLTTPAIDVVGTRIYNHKNIYVQEAPMPFLTERDGDFATAVNSPTKEIRGLDIMEQDWSIVHVSHDITETSNTIDLGMLVDAGKNIIMDNDTKIQNDWYLKLDGEIDLVGKSQLVQTIESDLDVSSAGSIERDQQGQSNLFNYNYWCSPVSPINTISNNTDYSIDSMMKDGTNPASPANINWIDGYDGAPTSPISLARYWLYTFDNYVNEYANWNPILETTTIRVGQGYTMKGSGASGTQNYVFTGKPNNGLINSNFVDVDQLLLTGNPYSSSLDASAFILDNSGSIDGTLYFWEHYSTNNTHILLDYQGGYAERNLVGGLPPVAPALISGLGSSAKTPGQFVPVGQGFFVLGNLTTGGTVTFNNNQRAFHKEDEVGVSNTMFKTTKNKKIQNTENNSNDPIVTDSYMKIRLGYNTNNSYHRQVLLGFMNEKATNGMDFGYDALNIDDFSNDMYFLYGENQLVIQGVGFFDENASYPIGVKADTEGKVTFMIDALENISTDQPIFIHDNVSDTYHNIQNQTYEVVIPAGVDHSRFSLRFTDKKLKTKQNSIDDIKITHIQNGNILEINNSLLDVTVEKMTLFNMLGQSISTWKIENQEQQNIRVPIKNISTGIYTVKIKTSKGESAKKIIIR